MSFRWALGLGDCDHDAAQCSCFASATATQSLDELAFARSACQAAAAGAVDKLQRILERAPDAVHSDGGKGAVGCGDKGVFATATAVSRYLRAVLHADTPTPNATGTSGYTPLHYAARAGQLECAALLLRQGAAADARTVQGRATPLHRAAHAGQLPVVELL